MTEDLIFTSNDDLVYKPNLGKRFLASFIDYTLMWIFTFVYIYTFGHMNEEGKMSVDGIMALLIPVAWLGYFVVLESNRGATLGHSLLKLRVVTVDRDWITFTQSLKRHLLDPLDFFLSIPALIAISTSRKHQRLGDMWARTVVVDITDEEQYRPFVL